MSNSTHAPPEFRGIFGEHGDSQEWLDAVSKFPNGVPRFSSKAEATEFMVEYNKYHGGSNPQHPHLMHIFTMLVSWEQIETILLPNLEKARKETSFAPKVPRDHLDDITGPDSKPVNPSTNVYEQPEAWNTIKDVLFRLNLPIHQCVTPTSTMNTLKYLFYHMKFGIFVMIRNGELRIFAPFVNPDYRNTWNKQLKLEGDGTLEDYYSEKTKWYRKEQIEPNQDKWWANGNIICNEPSTDKDKSKMQYWGDHFMSALRDMLAEACRERRLPDCEFFLNKRDYPQLKVNVPMGGVPVEPYGFIFDKDDRDPDQDVPLHPDHKFTTYAPIVSFYAAAPDRFADIPWPASEDWEGACGLVFPPTFKHWKDADGIPQFGANPRDLFTEENFQKFARGWDEDRVATAFFRGTATGGGTTVHNNQRLMVAHLSHEWKDDPEKGGVEPFLDAAIVGWNLRDKKVADGPMNYLRPPNFKFTAGKQHFTPIYEQSKYKYLVYVDGHCAACRYGFMMRLGSVILKVAPRQVADRMWYFDLLQPYVDHVPVKADLSDLEDQIRWCRNNDEKCREIGQNAMKFYEKYVSRNALLDYVEMVCKQMAKRYVEAPPWWQAPPPEAPPPELRKPDQKCFADKKSHSQKYCKRCQEEVEEEERQKAEEALQEKAKKKDKKKVKKDLRDRMRKRAAEKAAKTVAKKQKTS